MVVIVFVARRTNLCLLVSPKVVEYSRHALSFRIPDRTEAVAGHCTKHEAREVSDNKSDATAEGLLVSCA